jgi:hypothetical protein
MNVPFPAPCHVAVAGVGKQSVWGLRIIACSSISTVTSFPKFVNTILVGGKGNRLSGTSLNFRFVGCVIGKFMRL